MNMQRVAVWVLAALVVSVPAENGVTLPGVGSLTKAIGLVAFACGVLALFANGRFRIRPPSLFVVVALLFLFWNALTYFWSGAQAVTTSNVFTLAQLVVVAWLVWQFGRSEQDSALLMQAFVIGCYITIAVALVTFFAGAGTEFRNVGNFNPNTFAIVCALGIPIAWILALRPHGKPLAWLNLIYPLFAIVAIVLSASRGGLITGIVALTAVPAAMIHLSMVRRVILFALIAGMTWAAFIYAPQFYPELERNIERLSSTTDELTGGTLTGRTTIWKAALELFSSSPVGGIGSGAFASVAEPILGVRKDPHNAFLAVVSETGLVGLVLYMALLVSAALSVFGVERSRRPLFLIVLAALLVGMLPTNSENDKFAWIVLSLLAVQRPLVLLPAGWRGRAAARPAQWSTPRQAPQQGAR